MRGQSVRLPNVLVWFADMDDARVGQGWLSGFSVAAAASTDQRASTTVCRLGNVTCSPWRAT